MRQMAGQASSAVCAVGVCPSGQLLLPDGKCCEADQVDAFGTACCPADSRDCMGLCPSSNRQPHVVDQCGVCGGNNTSMGCDGVCNSGKVTDQCGVCGGDGSTCCSPGDLGCDGVCRSGKKLDQCGVCGGDGTRCSGVGCDCVPLAEGGKTLDACGVCGGNGSSCRACDGKFYPQGNGPKIDACDLNCSSSLTSGSSCKGCDGILGSNFAVDSCGVCGGDGSTCVDCLGVPYGDAKFDRCGVCRKPNDPHWNYCLGTDGLRRFNQACGPRCDAVTAPVPTFNYGVHKPAVAPLVDPKSEACKVGAAGTSFTASSPGAASELGVSQSTQSQVIAPAAPQKVQSLSQISQQAPPEPILEKSNQLLSVISGSRRTAALVSAVAPQRLSPVSITASLNANSSFPIGRAIDSDNKTYYMACSTPLGSNNSGWVQVDLGRDVEISKINFDWATWEAVYPGASPSAFTVSLIKNSGVAELVHTQAAGSCERCNDLDLSLTGKSARYIKLAYTKVNDATGWCLALNEVTVMGTSPAPVPTFSPGSVPNFQPYGSAANLATGVTATTGVLTLNSGTQEINIPNLGKRTVTFHTFQNNEPSKYCCPALFSFTGAGTVAPGQGWVAVKPNTQYRYSMVYKSSGDYANPNYLYKYEWTDGAYGPQSGALDFDRRIALGDGWYYAWGHFTTATGTTSINLQAYDYRYNVSSTLFVTDVTLTAEVATPTPTPTIDPVCLPPAPCSQVDITATLLGLDQATAKLRDLAIVNLKTLERRAPKIRSSAERNQLLTFIKRNRSSAKANYERAWKEVYTIGARINDRYFTEDCPVGGLCSKDYSPVLATYSTRVSALIKINTEVSKWFTKLKDRNKASAIVKQAASLNKIAQDFVRQIPAPKTGCIQVVANQTPTPNPRCVATNVPTATPTGPVPNTATPTVTPTATRTVASVPTEIPVSIQPPPPPVAPLLRECALFQNWKYTLIKKIISSNCDVSKCKPMSNECGMACAQAEQRCSVECSEDHQPQPEEKLECGVLGCPQPTDGAVCNDIKTGCECYYPDDPTWKVINPYSPQCKRVPNPNYTPSHLVLDAQMKCKQGCAATANSCRANCCCTPAEQEAYKEANCTSYETYDITECGSSSAPPSYTPSGGAGYIYDQGLSYWRLDGMPFLGCSCGAPCKGYCANGKGECQNDWDCQYNCSDRPGNRIDVPPCSWNDNARCVAGCPY